MGYNASNRNSPVAYDLENSPYDYSWGGFIFYFSTQAHRDKFANNINKKIDWLNDSLSRRFHIVVNVPEFAVFQLYQQIEGRGFYVIDCKTGDIFKNGNDIYFEVQNG